MEDTLEKLWNGTLAPAVNCGADNPEVKELVVLIEKNSQTLETMLDKKEKSVWENYLGCMEEYMYLITMHAFCDGYSLATKLMGEALLRK